jgi:hypothetical protein
LTRQPRIALSVPGLRLVAVVPGTIDLDYEPRAVVREIRDVPADRRLPANVEMQLPEFRPQPLLRERHLEAKPLRPRNGAGRMPIMLEARREGAGTERTLSAFPSFHPIPALPH